MAKFDSKVGHTGQPAQNGDDGGRLVSNPDLRCYYWQLRHYGQRPKPLPKTCKDQHQVLQKITGVVIQPH